MNTKLMASAILTPSSLSLSSTSFKKSTLLSTSVLFLNRNAPYLPPSLFQFSQWNGFKHFRISISRKSLKQDIKAKCNGKACASLFGVGAPEALVIGVVALLVFGPKGLAEVARNLGKTLREFQPTIRELQDVSNEFKSTLEREIGLDDIQTSRKGTFSSNPPSNITQNPSSVPSDESDGLPSLKKAYSTEDYMKITEEQLKERAMQQQKEQTVDFVEIVPSESSTQPQENDPMLPAPQQAERES
jgi:TatA/E family protein of Tat protein translocase